MKKILGISFVAMLSVSPLMAFADNPTAVSGTPVSYGSNQPTGAALTAVTAGDPVYQMAMSAETDDNAASAGYVKGAYNAAIKAVNTVAGDVSTLSSNVVTTAGDGLSKDGDTLNVNAGGGIEIYSKPVPGTFNSPIPHRESFVNIGLSKQTVDNEDYNVSGLGFNDRKLKVNAAQNGGITVDGDGVSLTNGIQDATNQNLQGGGLTTQGYVAEYVAGQKSGKAAQTGTENTLKGAVIDVSKTTANFVVMTDWATDSSTSSTALMTGMSADFRDSSVVYPNN